MKTAGRRQSANMEDRRGGNGTFGFYVTRVNENNDLYRKQSLGKRAAQQYRAKQKKINTKTSRVRSK